MPIISETEGAFNVAVNSAILSREEIACIAPSARRLCTLLQSLASGRMLMSTLSAGYDLAKGSWGRGSVTSSVLTVYVYITGRLIWLGSAFEDYKKKRDA